MTREALFWECLTHAQRTCSNYNVPILTNDERKKSATATADRLD